MISSTFDYHAVMTIKYTIPSLVMFALNLYYYTIYNGLIMTIICIALEIVIMNIVSSFFFLVDTHIKMKYPAVFVIFLGIFLLIA